MINPHRPTHTVLTTTALVSTLRRLFQKKVHSVENVHSLHSATKPPRRGETQPTNPGVAYTGPSRTQPTHRDASYSARRNCVYMARRSLHSTESGRSLHGATEHTRLENKKTQPTRRNAANTTRKKLLTWHGAAYTIRKNGAHTAQHSLHVAETKRSQHGAKTKRH